VASGRDSVRLEVNRPDGRGRRLRPRVLRGSQGRNAGGRDLKRDLQMAVGIPGNQKRQRPEPTELDADA
tara:strand:- start:1240 stop:1446 length:207 start_codon:yes stop_codon:yes gene_type:complete